MSDTQSVTLGELGIRTKHLADTARIIYSREGYRSNGVPTVSFVIPVHNMGRFLFDNLSKISANSREEHEFVIVLDDCTDDSLSELGRAAYEMLKSEVFLGLTVVRSSQSLFETVSDKVGIALSSGRFVIEVQSDMQIREAGFDSKMVFALQQNLDIFALSGRGCHQWDFLETSERSFAGRQKQRVAVWIQKLFAEKSRSLTNKFIFHNVNYFGRCGNWIENPGFIGTTIFLFETAMRGPLIFERKRYDSLGGFDATRFFLGDDDHDLTFRAWTEEQWRSGYLAIDFESPLAHGATRQPKSKFEVNEFSRVAVLYSKTRSISLAKGLVRPKKTIRPMKWVSEQHQ